VQDPRLIGLGFIGFAFAFTLFKFREATHDDDLSVIGVVAAVLAIARFAEAMAASTTAVKAVLIALAVNGLTKCIYAGSLGKARFAMLFGGASFLAIAAAGAVRYAANP
jgi:uncharacterized membrane protein (DUF4010 family)